MKDEILEEFKDWMKVLVNELRTGCKIPEPIENMNIFFANSTSLDEKREKFIWCFQKLNLDFKKCGDFCSDLQNCRCVIKEIKKFSYHFDEMIKLSETEN